MDSTLSNLLTFPPHPPSPNPMSDAQYDSGILEQIAAVKKISDAKLLQLSPGGENPLDVINPALHTIPYTFILQANIHALTKNTKNVDMNKIWDKMTGFLQTFDPRQMRYLPKEYLFIVESTADIARQNRESQLAIPAIRDAILRLDPSSSMLTWAHLNLVRLALESRAYLLAAPVLEKPILYFPGSSQQPKPKHLCDMSLSPAQYIPSTVQGIRAKYTYQDVLEYFLYSGMVFIGMREWEKALDCLEGAITYPAKENTSSKIMVEAYKKWILVGLLSEGKLLSLPKCTSAGAARSYHVLAKPYESLGQIFEGGSASRLKSEVEIGQQIWLKDCNIGLVTEVLAAYQRSQIRKLGDVYTRISVPEIVSQTTSAQTGKSLPSPAAAESLIQNMINSGELHATLGRPANSSSSSILTFSPTGVVLTEAEVNRKLVESTVRIQALTHEIKQTDRMLTHDKEYIKWMMKQKKIAKSGNNGGMDTLNNTSMEWNDALDDEDIMTGF